jgi:hypothetical protein
VLDSVDAILEFCERLTVVPRAPVAKLVVRSPLDDEARRRLVRTFFDRAMYETTVCFLSPAESATTRSAATLGTKTLWTPNVLASSGLDARVDLPLFSHETRWGKSLDPQNSNLWRQSAEVAEVSDDAALSYACEVLGALGTLLSGHEQHVSLDDWLLRFSDMRPLVPGVEREPGFWGLRDRDGRVDAMFRANPPPGTLASFVRWSHELLLAD